MKRNLSRSQIRAIYAKRSGKKKTFFSVKTIPGMTIGKMKRLVKIMGSDAIRKLDWSKKPKKWINESHADEILFHM